MNLRSIYFDLVMLPGIIRQRQPWCGPRIAQINISENCNLDCAICNRSSMGVSGLMDAKRVLSLVDELYVLGTQEVFFHGFGEPSCHPALPEMIQHIGARYPKLRQHLITNGTWDSPSLCSALVEGRVSTRFSLHAGEEETWQRIHPWDNLQYFKRAGENLLYLTTQAPDRVEVLFVLCSLNFRRIPEMVEYALDHGVKRILFRPMRLFRDRDGRYMNDSLLPDAEEYQVAARTIARFQKELRGKILILSVPFDEQSFDPELGRPSSRTFYLSRSCYIGYTLAVIERDGGVWGCLPESSEGKPLGNVFETSFSEIWYGKTYAAFRKSKLFLNKASLDHHGCHSYCQHLDTNLRLNRIKPWRSPRTPSGSGVGS